MVYVGNYFGIIIAVVLAISGCTAQCDDIDTKACELLFARNPTLCQDAAASTTCPRFCNQCPIVCYHCESSVRNHTDCQTARTCAPGEQCMIREVTSTRDGHHEYLMNCASIEMCDGITLTSNGRRDLISRDVNTHCCHDNLCNYPINHATTQTLTTTPETITTTDIYRGCNKDIEFLLQDSLDMSAPLYINRFLDEIINMIDIGRYANQVGFGLFDTGVHNKVSMDKYQNKYDLLRAISHDLKFRHSSNEADVLDVLKFINNKLNSVRDGDRPAYGNVVIIIADHSSSIQVIGRSGRSPRQVDASMITAVVQDVIIVNVGTGNTRSAFSALATDDSHVFNAPDYSSLSSIVPQVLTLLC